jgi:hypothetical protein
MDIKKILSNRIFLIIIIIVIGVIGIYFGYKYIPFFKKEKLGLQTVPTRSLHIRENPTHPKINERHGRGVEFSPDPWETLKNVTAERDKDRVEAHDQERTNKKYRQIQKPVSSTVFKGLLNTEKECVDCDPKNELDNNINKIINPGFYTEKVRKDLFMNEVTTDIGKIAPTRGQYPQFGDIIGKTVDGKPIRHSYPK